MAKSRVVPEHELFKVHLHHGGHMCELVAKRKMDQVAELSKGARYVCHICGRAAAGGASLCEPVKI
jgi:hypothetical protein